MKILVAIEFQRRYSTISTTNPLLALEDAFFCLVRVPSKKKGAAGSPYVGMRHRWFRVAMALSISHQIRLPFNMDQDLLDPFTKIYSCTRPLYYPTSLGPA